VRVALFVQDQAAAHQREQHLRDRPIATSMTIAVVAVGRSRLPSAGRAKSPPSRGQHR
jgi:hypothetical protein